ncbi:hypothetical protein DFJ74DRAFT_401267 [Hyaloraphidium curvatum]|nr:hypothetical protein DFJ74DRAFT_401267 [Hyaloraphidium curvatum]
MFLPGSEGGHRGFVLVRGVGGGGLYRPGVGQWTGRQINLRPRGAGGLRVAHGDASGRARVLLRKRHVQRPEEGQLQHPRRGRPGRRRLRRHAGAEPDGAGRDEPGARGHVCRRRNDHVEGAERDAAAGRPRAPNAPTRLPSRIPAGACPAVRHGAGSRRRGVGGGLGARHQVVLLAARFVRGRARIQG